MQYYHDLSLWKQTIQTMKSLLFQLVFIGSISLFVTSCSSDPCETVTCVNGACNEGVCDCAPGFKGAACDEIDYDFIGEFRSSAFILYDCPTNKEDESYPTDIDDKVCSTLGDVTTCFRVLLKIEDDGTFFLNQIKTKIEGSLSIGTPNVTEGSYTISGNTITLCEPGSSCQTMTLDDTQQELYWEQLPPKGDLCGIGWRLSRR